MLITGGGVGIGQAIAAGFAANCDRVWVEGDTWEMTEAQWDRNVDVNLKGTFLACSSSLI